MLKLVERVQLVDSCRQNAGLTVNDLWMRCVALGQMNSALELEAYLFGALRPTRQEFNLIAAALNEYLIEAKACHSIPYIEDGPDR
jgi:hypothetical protein